MVKVRRYKLLQETNLYKVQIYMAERKTCNEMGKYCQRYAVPRDQGLVDQNSRQEP